MLGAPKKSRPCRRGIKGYMDQLGRKVPRLNRPPSTIQMRVSRAHWMSPILHVAENQFFMLQITVKSNVDVVSCQLSALAYRHLPFEEVRTGEAGGCLGKSGDAEAVRRPYALHGELGGGAGGEQGTACRARVYPRQGGTIARTVWVRQRAVPGRQARRPRAGRGGGEPLRQPAAHGEVYGLWPRPAVQGAKKARGKAKGLTVNTTGKLKLLVAFHKPVQTKKRLEFGSRAQAVVSANFNRIFGAELAKAIATSASAQ
jgi:hypothetical protein